MDRFKIFLSGHFNRSSGKTPNAVVPLVCHNSPFVFLTLFSGDFLQPLARKPTPVTRFSLGNAGFTLMEMIITLAIASVLLMLSVPSLSTFVRANRITSETNTLVGLINTARSEASKRNCVVAMCRRDPDPSKQNPPECGGGTANNWTSGWLLYAPTPPAIGWTAATQANCNTEANFNPAVHTLLKEVSAIESGVIVTSNNAGDLRLAYLPNGRLNVTSTDPIRYGLCDDRKEAYGKVIEILPTGRPSLAATGAAGTKSDCTPTNDI